MLQITRIHNATSCAGYIQRWVTFCKGVFLSNFDLTFFFPFFHFFPCRAYSLARDYAHRRQAFGRKIIDLPLHTQTLARIDQVSKAAFTFAFEVRANFLVFYFYSFV